MADQADSITKEYFDAQRYDTVRDQLDALNKRVEALQYPATTDYQAAGRPMSPQEYLGKQTAGFDYLKLPPPATPEPVPDQIPEFAAEQRDWYLEKCVSTLQEATRIRADEALMKEIRAFIRRKRDEAASILDEIG